MAKRKSAKQKAALAKGRAIIKHRRGKISKTQKDRAIVKANKQLRR